MPKPQSVAASILAALAVIIGGGLVVMPGLSVVDRALASALILVGLSHGAWLARETDQLKGWRRGFLARRDQGWHDEEMAGHLTTHRKIDALAGMPEDGEGELLLGFEARSWSHHLSARPGFPPVFVVEARFLRLTNRDLKRPMSLEIGFLLDSGVLFRDERRFAVGVGQHVEIEMIRFETFLVDETGRNGQPEAECVRRFNEGAAVLVKDHVSHKQKLFRGAGMFDSWYAT